MGYYTYYELYIDNMGELDDLVVKNVDKAIEEMNVLDSNGSPRYGWSAYTKWYGHDEDMQLLSYRFPDVVFELRGDGGEESEDVWSHYYKGGRAQTDGLVVTYTYNRFDESKLQPLAAKQIDTLEKELKELEENV